MEDQIDSQIQKQITIVPKASPLLGSEFASAYSPSPNNPRAGLSKISLVGSKQSIGGDSISKNKDPRDFMDFRKELNDCIENFNKGIDKKLASNDADFMAAYRVSSKFIFPYNINQRFPFVLPGPYVQSSESA